MRLLFLTSEQWPTFRVDLTVLFGKYLARQGLFSDLVTEQDVYSTEVKPWSGGKTILCRVPKYRAAQYILKFLHQCKILLTSDYNDYDAVQVRDMTIIAIVAILICKIRKKPFFYWLSYPQSEGQIQRAKARGIGAGMRYWFPLLQGAIGKVLLYQFILPRAKHIFVQSEKMLEMVAKQGVPTNKMTAVPMGVDLEATQMNITPSEDVALRNKRVLVYLGTLDRVRQIEVLFSMLAIVREHIPNVLLVLVGDTEDTQHRTWLKEESKRLNVSEAVLWTSWLPMQEAWRYVVAAEVGLSPIPRGYLLDMGSPTKAVEYMALGLPVVMNDNPDQAQVAKESGAALCVPLTPESFAQATLQLLNNADIREDMRQKGLSYVTQVRGYAQLASNLYQTYYKLISKLS